MVKYVYKDKGDVLNDQTRIKEGRRTTSCK